MLSRITFNPHSHPYVCVWETVIYISASVQGSCPSESPFQTPQAGSNTLLIVCVLRSDSTLEPTPACICVSSYSLLDSELLGTRDHIILFCIP